MSHKKSERGMALIVTLLLGLIAAALIGALMYTISATTQISGINMRHKSALEAVNGGASYIQNGLLPGSELFCSPPSNSTESYACHDFKSEYEANNADSWDWTTRNATVNFEINSDIPNYDVQAKMISAYEKIDGDKKIEIYTFNVIAESNSISGEISEAEFVYKLEWKD